MTDAFANLVLALGGGGLVLLLLVLVIDYMPDRIGDALEKGFWKMVEKSEKLLRELF